MKNKQKYLEYLKNAKDVLYKSVRERDKILYAQASDNFIFTLRM